MRGGGSGWGRCGDSASSCFALCPRPIVVGRLRCAGDVHLDLRGGRLSLSVEGMAWWSGDGLVQDGCVGFYWGIAGESLVRPWADMTTATPFGAVPLLGGVVLALTPSNTKNPLREWFLDSLG
uniref:Uncharacterized protein n=1 Tax=Oryza meridionalis TaxID=40149 RepID=A0A0E0EE53_9ORYZ